MSFQILFVAVFVVFGLHFKCSEQSIVTISSSDSCVKPVLPIKELCGCLSARREVFYKSQTKYFVEANIAVNSNTDVGKCGPFPYKLPMTIEQCSGTGHERVVLYKNMTVGLLDKNIAPEHMQTVFGCYLFSGETTNISRKGKQLQASVKKGGFYHKMIQSSMSTNIALQLHFSLQISISITLN